MVTAAASVTARSLRLIRGSPAAEVGSTFAAAPYGVRKDGGDEHDIEEISHETSPERGHLSLSKTAGRSSELDLLLFGLAC